VPPDRSQSKFTSLTVSVTDGLRDGLQKIADSETLSLSAVARRAFREEIQRRDRAEAERDDARG
jgi:predicted transcriptional regulator